MDLFHSFSTLCLTFFEYLNCTQLYFGGNISTEHSIVDGKRHNYWFRCIFYKWVEIFAELLLNLDLFPHVHGPPTTRKPLEKYRATVHWPIRTHFLWWCLHIQFSVHSLQHRNSYKFTIFPPFYQNPTELIGRHAVGADLSHSRCACSINNVNIFASNWSAVCFCLPNVVFGVIDQNRQSIFWRCNHHVLCVLNCVNPSLL